MRAEVSKKAAQALGALFRSIGSYEEIRVPNWTVPRLIDTLRDAPDISARLVAAEVLRWFVSNLPEARRLIADEGGMWLVLAFLVDVGEVVWDKEQWGAAWTLADVLLRWQTAAVHDLQRGICGPHVDLAWISLSVLRVR
jgi:hypothetical protein